MKKVKTVLGSLFVMLASVLISACSCSGGGDPVNHIYVKDISIRCLNEQDENKVTHTLNEKSGVLTVYCHVNDTFEIEYTLSPDNTTTTQVNWNITYPDRVRNVDGVSYRANSTIEVVEFKGTKKTDKDQPATITFSTYVGGDALATKTAVCNVYVYDEVTKLPSLSTPKNLDLVEAETSDGVVNRIQWSTVQNYIPVGLDEEDAVLAPKADGKDYALGLKGYELLLKDENGNIVSKDSAGNPGKTLITPDQTCYPTDDMIRSGNYVNIESGKKYIAEVSASGDQGNAKNSKSASFNFYKIETVKTFNNDNGRVTFTAPANSCQYEVGYVKGLDPVLLTNAVSDGTDVIVFDCNANAYKSQRLYEFTVKSYPKYSNTEVESGQTYAVYADGYRYYPSSISEKYNIQRLSAPKLSLDATNQAMTIGGKDFGDVNSSTIVVASVDANYDFVYGQTFDWEIKNENTSFHTSKSSDNKFSLANLQAGDYIITVKTIGNAENTISSEVVNTTLRVLPSFSRSNVTLNGDILTYAGNPVIGGMDLFFVYTGEVDSTKGLEDQSQHLSIDKSRLKDNNDGGVELDISTLELEAGPYSLYAKPIHYIDSTTSEVNGQIQYSAVNTVGKITLNKLFDFSIAKKVNSEQITIYSDGTLTFERVKDNNGEYFSEYKLYWRNYNFDIPDNQMPGFQEFVLTDNSGSANSEQYRFAYTIDEDNEDIASVQVRDILEAFVANYNKGASLAGQDLISVDGLLLNNGDDINMKHQIFLSTIGKNAESGTSHYISSSKSPFSGVYFESRPVLSDFALNNYSLEFEYDESNLNVVVELMVVEVGNDSATPSYYKSDNIATSKTTNGIFSISLYVDELENIRKNIKSSSDYENHIRIIIRGTEGYNGLTGKWDYQTMFRKFDVTSQPENVAIAESNGVVTLSWESANIGTENTTYTINYYSVVDNVSTSIGRQDGIAEGSYDVTSILSANEGKVIAFEVIENNTIKLNGDASSSVYASKLYKPTLQYHIVGSKESIIWQSKGVDNTYDVYVDGTLKSENLADVTTIEEDDFYYFQVPSLQTGFKYIISIGAKYAPTTTQTSAIGSNVDNPLIINSEQTTIPVYFVSKNMTLSVNNLGSSQALIWQDICTITPANDTATYTLSQGANTYEVVGKTSVDIEELIGAGFVFEGGANNITISPSVNFADVTIGEDDSQETILGTGIILLGTINNSLTVSRWFAPTITGTENGRLVVSLGNSNDAISSSNITIDLFDKESQIDANKFSVDYDQNAKKYYIDVFGLGADVETAYEFTVSVRSTDVLTSDISNAYNATKIAKIQVGNDQTTSFQKIGNWLQWKPIENATKYIISYALAIEEKYETIELEVAWDSANSKYNTYIVRYVTDEGGATTSESTTSEDFIYDGGYFKYKFDESVFFKFSNETENIVSGDLYLTIRPLTNLSTYLNGDVSEIYTITRLNNNEAWITVDGGVIKFAPYSNSEEVELPEEEEEELPEDPTEPEVIDETEEPGEEEEDNTTNSTGSNLPIGYIVTISKVIIIETTTGEGDDAQTTEEEKVVAVYTQEVIGNYSIADIDLNEKSALAVAQFTENGTTYNIGQNVPFTADGKYILTLQYLGNDNNIIDSQVVSVDLTKTAQTQLHTEGGSLAWTTIENAEYKLEFNSNKEGSTPIYYLAGQDSLISNDVLLNNGLSAGKTYSVRVLAYKAGELHSEWSDVFSIYLLKAPTTLTMTTAQSSDSVDVLVKDEEGNETTETINYSIGSPIFTWLANNNISTAGDNYPFNFELVYIDAEGNKTIQVIKNPKSLRTFVDNNLPVGTVKVKIRMIGNNCYDLSKLGVITSEYSSELEIKYLDETSSVSVTNGVIDWSAVNGSEGIRYYNVSAYEKTAYDKYVEDLAEYEAKLEEKESAEDPDSVVVPSKPTINTLFTQKVTTNTLDFTKIAYSDISATGGITVVINAITNPNQNVIISAQAENPNSASMFKTPVVSNLAVKDGMLNWTLDVDNGKNDDIESFVAGFIVPAIGEDGANEAITSADSALSDVIKYVFNKVNFGEGKVGDVFATDETLESQISYLLNIRMNYNNNVVIVQPTKVIMLDVNGKETTSYVNAKTLEYFYDVVSEPEIANPEEPAMASEGDSATYERGKYIISLSSVGNSDGVVSIISSGYTGNLRAFKPDAPQTWGSYNADTDTVIDISNGNVQWKLPTTAEKGAGNNLTNHTRYFISATALNSDMDSRIISTVVDTTQIGNASNPSEYSIHLENLFRPAPNVDNVFTYTSANNTVYLNTITFDGYTDSAKFDKYTNKYAVDSSNKLSINYLGDSSNTISVQLETEDGTYTIYDPKCRYIQITYKVESSSVIEMKFTNTALKYNQSYRLSLYTMGSVYATANDSQTNYVYLNSNTSFISEEVCYLNTPSSISFNNSNMNWSSVDQATATKLFIYGPFDNLSNDKNYRNLAWAGLTTQGETDVKYVVNDSVLSALYKAHNEGSTPNYAYLGLTGNEKLQIITLGAKDEMGTRDTSYTLTDNNRFADGGYIVHFQHIGNGRGVIDSGVTAFNQIDNSAKKLTYYQSYENAVKDTNEVYDFNAIRENGQKSYAVEKLSAVVEPQSTIGEEDNVQIISTGWVGNSDTISYRWLGDGAQSNKTIATNEYWQQIENDAVDQETGAFVWQPVIGANAFKVTLYEGTSTGYSDVYTVYTRETRHILLDGIRYQQNSSYYIEIIPIRTEDTNYIDPTDYASGVPTLATSFFNGDLEKSTTHEMIPVPTSLAINSNGQIKWDGVSNTSQEIACHYIQINKNDTLTTQIKPETSSFSINDIEFLDDAVGKIGVQIKAVANNGKASDNDTEEKQSDNKLSSIYSVASFVERLADPMIRLENGILKWISGTPQTDSELWINTIPFAQGVSPEVLTEDGIMMYGDVVSHNNNYSSEKDEREYPVFIDAGSDERYEYRFNVRYQGNINPDENNNGFETMRPSNTYIVASKVVPLIATKLSTPETDNSILVKDGVDYNVVEWDAVANAQGYRVRAFSDIRTINEEDEVVIVERMIEKEVGIEELERGDSTFFETQDEKVYFLLDQILGEGDGQFNISENGVRSINIYVQALGSNEEPIIESDNQTNELYLSSSYSTFTTIGVPPRPIFNTNTAFDTNTATLNWDLDGGAENAGGQYNIKITSTYNVYNVTNDEFNNYWIVSANKYRTEGSESYTSGSALREYPEITNRQFEYNYSESQYNLTVTDTIVLLVKDNNGKTPLSYQFTNMGSDYQIKIVAMSYSSDNNETNKFVSLSTTLDTTNKEYTINVFSKGDGSSRFPYEVDSYGDFNSIRNFTTRSFILTDGISFVDEAPWTPINKFSGTIDGQGNTVTAFANDTKYSSFALVVENSGTIKNLEMSNPNIALTGSGYAELATIAVKNNATGIIENVTINNATLSAIVNGDYSGQKPTYVGGLVVYNYGTITNSKVDADITALDDSTLSTNVGGIAGGNIGGTIEYSSFAGSMLANAIGGIVSQNNKGIIDRCSVDNAILTVTDRSKSYSSDGTNKYKGAIIGGVTGTILGEGATISNSYSKAQIITDKRGVGRNSTMNVAGLVASIGAAEIVISGNYVAFFGFKSAGTDAPTSINYMIPVPAKGDQVFENNFYVLDSSNVDNKLTTLTADKGVEVILTESQSELRTALSNAGLGNVYDLSDATNPYPTLKAKA